jgi:hypothetical protein
LKKLPESLFLKEIFEPHRFGIKNLCVSAYVPYVSMVKIKSNHSCLLPFKYAC